MRQKTTIAVVIAVFVLGAVCAGADKKALDKYSTVVIEPFEASVKGAIGLPEATRSAVTQAMKEAALFQEVLTAEEAKAKEEKKAEPAAAPGQAHLEQAKATETETPRVLKLQARLVDFEPGSAAKRLMVGFGSGRAHAGFEFTLKDAATGEVVWQKTIKQTASFWFNSTTSSAAERAELPEGLAKKAVQEITKAKGK